MGSPAIFKGPRTGLLSSKGLSLKDGSIVDNDGVPNFIKNGHAEINTTGWATYADAAGASPVDGTGGSANITWTRSTTTPLAGSGSFLFTKDAANRQGQGASYDFTVDPAFQARVINIQFDYIVSSGTFAAGTSSTDSDVTVWIYDVTNSTLIQPSSFRLLSNSSSIADTFQASFQTSATGTSYRLILHCSTTSASAYTVKFDNVQVTPTEYAFGTPVTDWIAYTPTFTGFGTPTSVNFISRRVGDTLEIKGVFTNGTPTATEGRIALGYGGASGNVTSVSTLPTLSMAGKWIDSANGSTTDFRTRSVLIEASKTYLTFGAEYASVTGGALTKQNGNAVSAASSVVSIFASVPIAGWSSSVQTSDQTSTRVVDFVGSSTTGQSITANTTKFTFTAYKDSHNAWSTDTYTVPVAGDYMVSLSYYQTTSGAMAAYVHVNGAAPGSGTAYLGVAGGSSGFAGSGTVILYSLKAGDLITIKGDATQTLSAGNRTLSISRISGPNQIAASETVAARYEQSSSQSIASGATATIFNYSTKVFDTHGAVTTGASWKFTAPISGTYLIQAQNLFDLASWIVDADPRIFIYKNGSAISGSFIATRTGGTFYPSSVRSSATIKLNAGDYIDARLVHNDTVARSTIASVTYNTIDVIRVGN